MCAPVGIVQPSLNRSLKGTVRPFSGCCTIPVLDRVVVNIVDVGLPVLFIADVVFPKPSLPNAFFSFMQLGGVGDSWL